MYPEEVYNAVRIETMKQLGRHSVFISLASRLLKTARNIDNRIFFITCLYYALMFFCTSNITLLLLSLAYFFLLWKITKNIGHAAFLSFLVNLPFVKGKSIALLLLPKEMTMMNVRKDLFFYFPLTVSDFYLAIICWISLHKRPKVFNTLSFGIITSVVLFFLISVISIFSSQNIIVSWLSSLLLFKFIIIFFLPKIINLKKELMKSGLLAIASFTLFESIWGITQYIFHGNLGRYIESFSNTYVYGKVAWENTNLLRISGTFVDPDIFGTFMLMHFVMFFYLWLKQKYSTLLERTIYILCTVLSGVSIFMTGNRILYIVICISAVLLIVITKQGKQMISILKKPWSIVITLLIAVLIFPYISARLQNLSAVFSPVGSATFRMQMIQYTIRLGVPNWFGVGLGMSPYHFATNFPGENMIFGPDYPHNIFSQIFAETGIFGLVAFLIFLYGAFRRLLIKGLQIPNVHFYLAAFAWIISACFYPLFIPLVELPAFFFLYLGIATFGYL